MDPEELRLLLNQSENVSLEFKQEWYKLDSDNEVTADIEKNELIKDILSLANGNSAMAAEAAYLVIGAADRPGEDGNRQLFDVALERAITRDRLLKVVNAVCSPRLPDLILEQIPVEGKNLVVITMPPSPYVHETTKRLQTAKRTFDEWSVFIRYGDNIKVASTHERVELARIKKTRFDELRNAPPIAFGAGIGAVVGVALVPAFVRRYATTKEETIASGLVAFLAGGFVGGFLGNMFKDYQSARVDWLRVPIWGRVLAVAGGGAVTVLSWIAMRQVGWKAQSVVERRQNS